MLFLKIKRKSTSSLNKNCNKASKFWILQINKNNIQQNKIKNINRNKIQIKNKLKIETKIKVMQIMQMKTENKLFATSKR